NKMEEIYQGSDVLLLTSADEGLPLAVMEMMAYGKVIVSTAVGGIPDYVQNGKNGFLIKNDDDENRIINEGISVLSNLVGNTALLEKVGEENRMYAEKHFSVKAFCDNYRKILFE